MEMKGGRWSERMSWRQVRQGWEEDFCLEQRCRWAAIYRVRSGRSGGEGDAFLGMSGVGVARATAHQVLAEDN